MGSNNLKRIFLYAVIGASALGLTACGASSPDPVEQIIVSEPGQTPPPVLAAIEADPAAAGAADFAACAACHTVESGPGSGVVSGVVSGVGPNLFGVVGRKAGSVDGFAYSDAMRASGLTWDAASLDAFLADPAATVAGTTMTTGAIADADRRSAVIAYLSSLSE